MPRRLPVRPAKLIGNLFVLFVLMVISFIYYVYVVVIWGPKIISKLFPFTHPPFTLLIDDQYVMVLLVFFHLFFVLLIWSFFQAMTTDPG